MERLTGAGTVDDGPRRLARACREGRAAGRDTVDESTVGSGAVADHGRVGEPDGVLVGEHEREHRLCYVTYTRERDRVRHGDAAEAGRCEQHEGVDPPGEQLRERRGDRTAQRVADQA